MWRAVSMLMQARSGCQGRTNSAAQQHALKLRLAGHARGAAQTQPFQGLGQLPRRALDAPTAAQARVLCARALLLLIASDQTCDGA
jgi:hypothetical protein